MMRTILEDGLDINQRVATRDSPLGSLFYGICYCLDVGLGDGPSHYLILKEDRVGVFTGFKEDYHVAILAMPSGLLYELLFYKYRPAQGLLIGHLGRAHVGIHLVFAEHTVLQHLQMEFPHTRDYELSRLIVHLDAKGRVFLL